jgi:hypothetical protein
MFVFKFFNLLSVVFAHSWLHCVDYNPSASLNAGQIQNRFCSAFPRGLPDNANFGEDRGYNYQPIRDKACRNNFNGVVHSFRKGETIRLLWPAKNHVSAPCTNPNIRDQSLRLYLFPTQSLNQSDPSFSVWATNQYLYYDFKRDGKGFQNCPDACPVVDRLPCFGDVFFRNTLSTGLYKALWVWIFNPNERFTSCFDLRITDTAPTTKAPTAKAPTAKAPTAKAPTAKAPTTKAPTAKAPTAKAPTSGTCSKLFQQCGGINWKGATCCERGTCVKKDDHYSQCV